MQRHIRSGFFGLAVVLGFVALIWFARTPMGPLGKAVDALRARPGAAERAAPAVAKEAPGGAEEPSHLADELGSSAGDIMSDLRIVDSVLAAYRSSVHSGNPVGENAEITAALTGRNKLGFAFIAPDHPAINAKGELCDRWGTPFFFHQLSGTAMEIRSAGPDRRLWTKDDQVLTPQGQSPSL